MNGMNNQNGNFRICQRCGAKIEKSFAECPFCSGLAKRSLAAKKRKRTRAIVRLCLCAAAFVLVLGLFVFALFSAFSDKEPLFEKARDYENVPVFYTLANDEVYYLSPKNESVFLGSGEIRDFVSSFDGKTVYLLLYGKTDKDSHAQSGDFLLKIEDFKNVSTLAYANADSITFVSGLDADYMYYLISEETNSDVLSSRLYVVEKGKQAQRIADLGNAGRQPSFSVSPNGHYLIFSTDDGGGTKLVKYCAKNQEQISLGVKNCLPVSIDNKGEYFSYIKKNTEELYDFYVETDVENRQKVSLSCEEFNKIVVSNDMRSFALDVGAYTSFKTVDKDAFSVITNKESNYSYLFDESARLSVLNADKKTQVLLSTKSNFLPFSYYDEESGNIVYISKDGEKALCFSEVFSDFAVSKDSIAYVFQNSLYFGRINGERSESTSVIDNFSTLSLRDMSTNGKYIFYSDSDGNLFRCTNDGKHTVKLAVDVEKIQLSENGEQFIYLSDSVLILRRKNGKAQSIDSNVLKDMCISRTDNFSSLVYAKYHTENAVTKENADLCVYDKKGTSVICENVKSVLSNSENILFK